MNFLIVEIRELTWMTNQTQTTALSVYDSYIEQRIMILIGIIDLCLFRIMSFRITGSTKTRFSRTKLMFSREKTRFSKTKTRFSRTKIRSSRTKLRFSREKKLGLAERKKLDLAE